MTNVNAPFLLLFRGFPTKWKHIVGHTVKFITVVLVFQGGRSGVLGKVS